MAASAGHGRVVTRSYESLLETQQAALAQSRAIQAYMKLGCQFEAKKQWVNAEKSYKYVLQVIALRDGPGSAKSVPALQRLVTVSAAQNEIDRAIGFQETVLAFAQRAAVPDIKATLDAQLNLSSLFVHKEDYTSAESVLADSIALCNATSSVQPERRRLAFRTYAKVLRKLHKDSAADKIEVLESENAKATDISEGVSAKLEQRAQSVLPTTDNAGQPQLQISDGTKNVAPQNSKGTAQPAEPARTIPEQAPKEVH
jgi:hypothetical protein